MRELLARYGLTLPAEDYPPLPLVLDEEVLEAQPDQVSLTARFVDEAAGRFVRQQRDRPWFLYLAHIDMRLELGDGRLGVRVPASGPSARSRTAPPSRPSTRSTPTTWPSTT